MLNADQRCVLDMHITFFIQWIYLQHLQLFTCGSGVSEWHLMNITHYLWRTVLSHIDDYCCSLVQQQCNYLIIIELYSCYLYLYNSEQ